MAARNRATEQGLLRGIPAIRIKLIERIAAEARQRIAGTSLDLRRRFLRGYFRGVGEEDLSQRAPAELSSAALRHLETGYQRPKGRPLVEVLNPDIKQNGFSSPHTVISIVTEDMPFLVDSLGVALSKAGVAIHLLIHPVLWVKRDAKGRLLDVVHGAEEGAHSESWQFYEVDRQTDPEHLEALRAKLESVIEDVRRAVEDWMPMRERVRTIAASLRQEPPPLPPEEIDEAHALLDWIEARHFVFLGYRHYKLVRGEKSDRLVSDPRSGLGILRENGPANDKQGTAKKSSTTLKGEVRDHARARELLILTKANSTATVHRGHYIDYVGIKTFGPRGEVTGEHRFLGLWTSTAYYSSPTDIPVLRKKIEKVIDHFALDPASHDAKAVLHVLETYPRDELFQASVDDLIRISRGVVNLYERRTVRLLARRDPYHRFYSCLIYVPRDRYNTEVRLAIEQIVADGIGGTTSGESQVQISDSNHARLHVVVRTDPNDRRDHLE
jgi:glutamate dehydrogenase